MTETLEEHAGYLTDRVKLARYQSALERAVRTDDLVLDLGCGTGVLGLLALRAGARKVFFVDEGAVIEIARQAVAGAGFADRAEFFQVSSFELALPKKVDVVVCDHVGYFGFDYGILDLLADARQRFLKTGGILIPEQIDLQLAPVTSLECRKLVEQWRDGSVPSDYDWLSATAANTTYTIESKAEQLLSRASSLVALELGAEATPYMSWGAEFECARDGMLDGLAGWFDCRLFDDIRMTNSPTVAARLDRPQIFLPLESPIAVSLGENIRVTVMVRHRDHIIGWSIELAGSGKRFSHSTFNSLLLNHESLAHIYPTRVAALNERGRARQAVLSYCDGQRTVAEVQALVQREHPQLFPSARATASFVRHVLARDTSE